MTTINTALQSMINSLHSRLISADVAQQLTPEEMTLVANAIANLQSHASWEQALIAIAEFHLNTSTESIESANQSLATTISELEVIYQTFSNKSESLDVLNTLVSDLNSIINNLSSELTTLTNTKIDELSSSLQVVKDSNIDYGTALPCKSIQTAVGTSAHVRPASFISIYDELTEKSQILVSSWAAGGVSGDYRDNSHYYEYSTGKKHNSGLLTLKKSYISGDSVLVPSSTKIFQNDNITLLPLLNSLSGNIEYTYLIILDNDSRLFKVNQVNSVSTLCGGNEWGAESGTDQYGVAANAKTSFIYDQDTNTVIIVGSDGLVRRVWSDKVEVLNQSTPLAQVSVLGWLNTNIPNRINFSSLKQAVSAKFYGFIGTQIDELTTNLFYNAGHTNRNITNNRNFYWIFNKNKKLVKIYIDIELVPLSIMNTNSGYQVYTLTNSINIYMSDESEKVLFKCNFIDSATGTTGGGSSSTSESYVPLVLDLKNRKLLVAACSAGGTRSRRPFGGLITGDGASVNYGAVIEFIF